MGAAREKLERFAAASWAPAFVLGAGGLLVALFALRYGVRVNVYALDESQIKQSAVNYTHGLPDSLLHDYAARGSARLYSLIQSPIFRIWDGDTAVRWAKVLNALLFASTAIPIWLLARRLLSSRWAACGAALLSIAAPWLALTSLIFTENLCYPLYAWFLLALAWCLQRPSAKRDFVVLALAVALTFTRVQMWTTVLLWPLVVVVLDFATEPARRPPRRARRLLTRHPFAFGAVALAALYVLYLMLITNTLKVKFNQSLGTYSEIGYRHALPHDYFLGIFVEFVHFGAALGVIPVVAAVVFWVRRLGARARADWPTVFAIMAVTAGMLLATLFAQGGYLEAITEDRYYMYAVPLAWIGAFGLFELERVRLAWLAVAAGALVLLFAVVPIQTPLTPEFAILAAGGAAAGHVVTSLGSHLGHMTQADTLALLGALLAAIALAVWRWLPRWRRLAWIALPAILQLALTIYVFGAIDGRVNGVPARTGSLDGLSWVDRSVGGATATWLDSQRKPDTFASDLIQREALFWNQRIGNVVAGAQLQLPPVTYPLGSVTIGWFVVNPRTGGVQSSLPLDYVVQPRDSPFMQLRAARAVSHSLPGRGLELIVPGRPAQARWFATGMIYNGTIRADKAARLRAYGDGRLTVTLRFAGAQPGDGVQQATGGVARLRLGPVDTTVSVPASGSRRVTVAACGPLSGSVRALSGLPQLVAVSVRESGRC